MPDNSAAHTVALAPRGLVVGYRLGVGHPRGHSLRDSRNVRNRKAHLPRYLDSYLVLPVMTVEGAGLGFIFFRMELHRGAIYSEHSESL